MQGLFRYFSLRHQKVIAREFKLGYASLNWLGGPHAGDWRL
jgi:hypothetical protein